MAIDDFNPPLLGALKDHVEQARTFEHKRTQVLDRANKQKSYVIVALIIACLSLAAALFVMLPLKEYVPVLVYTDRSGVIDTSVHPTFDQMREEDVYVTTELARWLTSCENYTDPLAAELRKACVALVDDSIREKILTRTDSSNPQRNQVIYGVDGYVKVVDLPTVILDPPPADQIGKALSLSDPRYRRRATIVYILEDQPTGQPKTIYKVSNRLEFHFKNMSTASVQSVQANPLGIVVTFFNPQRLGSPKP